MKDEKEKRVLTRKKPFQDRQLELDKRSLVSLSLSLYINVRRGQSDQIWRNFAALEKCQKSLDIIEGLFSIWQNFEPTWENFQCFGQIYIVVNGQIVEK